MEDNYSSNTKYGFIDENIFIPCTTSNFIKKYGDVVGELIDNPNTEILITDFGGGIPIARFLKQYCFRNVVLYHTGNKPKFNICKFTSLKGGFITKENCQDQIEKDCKIVYKMSNQ